VFESYTALRRTAKIRIHLVPLTSRFATDRLTALTQSTGAVLKTVPEVLFVCVHNAGRSQMAAGLLDHHVAGRLHVRSAGSAPADEIGPAVREAMTEIGLDISREFPKPLTADVVDLGLQCFGQHPPSTLADQLVDQGRATVLAGVILACRPSRNRSATGARPASESTKAGCRPTGSGRPRATSESGATDLAVGELRRGVRSAPV
jgi:hypothetical protein